MSLLAQVDRLPGSDAIPGTQTSSGNQTSPGTQTFPSYPMPSVMPPIWYSDPLADRNVLQQRPPAPAPEMVPAPPEPDNEFQQFIANSLGYHLPIFGQNLFQNVPSTFAPLDRVPVTPDYFIGPGDELLVRAWGQVEFNARTVVDRNGAIYLPKVGGLNVAGLRYDQLHDYMAAAIGRVFKNFELSVTMGQLRSLQVFVVGQVKRPGTYTVSSLSTLVNALFASGGPSNRGSMRRIQLKRQGKTVTTFDLYDLLVLGDKSKDVTLLSGDVIYVPPVGPLVALAGSVNLPAVFELQDHDTLGSAIAFAGGLTSTAAGERVMLERIDQHQTRREDEFPLSANGLKRELHDGDLVRFLPVSLRFENAITLRGNVALPGRYPWRAGMHVHDLIPTREALITEEYWKRQNQLAIGANGQRFQPLKLEPDRAASAPAPEGGRAPSTPEVAGAAGTDVQHLRPEEIKNEVKRSAAEINWDYAVIQRLDRDNLTTHLLPFNLGRAIAGDDQQNLLLEAGDVVTIFSQQDLQVPIAQQSKFVRMEGEFRFAGVYQVQPGETLRHLVGRIGGFTSQAYLYGAEFTRESTREDQQKRLDQYVNELGKSIERNAVAIQGRTGDEAAAASQALEGQRRLLEKLHQLKATGRIVLELKASAASLDQFPDLVLEDGDRLFVPFRPATVDVIGSVYNSSAFVFKPGKTVGDYLRISGGITKTGDHGRTFVIRADGSTISGQNHKGLIFNSFSSLRMAPGDTIVVPEKLDRGLLLRGFRDWTQVISQFVIGAAAAKVLFP
ncbi:MAG: SLBB domain-containing protein [Acidobacteriia bacterium]|nr:SLBB domain-containing protein [Terriglobia bacterium]